MNETSPKPSPEKPGKGEKLAGLNRPHILWPAGLALAIVFFFVLRLVLGAFTHESTDDAFIAGHIVSVAPRVAGQVSAVYVRDNQLVQSNDLLFELDPADYAMTHSQKESSAEAQNANYQTVLAALELMQAKVVTAKATASESAADAEAAAATATRAKADFTRAQDLRNQKTISAQEFDVAQATADEAEANLRSAKQKADADSSKVVEAEAQLNATKTAAVMALAQSRSAQKDADSAQLNLTYTKVYAPVAGRVTRKSVETGDYLQVGQQTLFLVPTDVWVVANFKESQLEEMAPGQPVAVEIDALGGRSFRAHVDSIQAGSGAQYSLLPPENATGNFVKVVQRVPVKIIFDEPLPADKILGPGLSVVPTVQVSKWALPVWGIALASLLLAVATVFTFRAFTARPATAS